MTPSTFLGLAWASLRSRGASALLTILSVALAVTLFLGVDKIRHTAEDSFSSTISGTDLIVGARSGSINLLLYSVFRIGEPTTNISWEAYERYADRPDVAWTIPISLGDSHKGYRVLGTTDAYFEHFRYGNDRALTFGAGDRFDGMRDAVVGAEVAKALGYNVGDSLVISHGLVSADFADHADDPFTVVGILERTGTPVDRTVHITLAGLDAVHDLPVGSAVDDADTHDHDGEDTSDHAHDHEPTQVTAFFVGMQNRVLALRLQRDVNTDRQEPLQAILPGIALAQLWEVVGAAEMAFLALSGFVVVTGLFGVLATLLSSLHERRREIAVLRAVGARGRDIFSLLMVETVLITAVGCLIGAATVYGGLYFGGPMLEDRFGVPMPAPVPTVYDAGVVGVVMALAAILGLIPAWRAYRHAVADGLSAQV